MWARLGAGGLGLPEPPGPLASSISAVGERRWGSDHRPAFPPRDIGAFERQFVEGSHPGDYVVAAVVDAATNLPAVHYLLAFGRLGLFVQADGRDGRGAELLAAAGDLQDRALGAFERRLLPDSGRLVVLHSFVGVRRWRWTGDQMEDGLDGIFGATGWLDARVPPSM